MSECTNLFSCTWVTPWNVQLDVCQGVAHVHENGFVYSDIKFEKVLLEEVAHGRSSAKLSDFDLADGDAVCLYGHLPIFPRDAANQTIPRHLRKDIVIMVA